MLLVALATLLIVLFINNAKALPFLLITYFVFYDMFDGFYDDNKIFAILRYVIPIGLLLLYYIKYNILGKLELIFAVLIFYLLGLWVLNPGDPIITSRVMVSVIITLMMVPIGISLARDNYIHSGFESSGFIIDFEKYNRLILIAIPIYIFYANITGIAGYYTEYFTTGYLITSRMYIVPIVVFLAIHYTMTNKDRSWLLKGTDVIFILINIAILIVNTRRTALGMLVGAILTYIIFNRQLILKMVVMIFAIIAGLILSYPLYQQKLTAQLEKRDRIKNLDTYEEEGRVLETLYIIEYHKKNHDIGEILCGVKLFDTYSFGERYFGRGRPIHSDINMLFYSTGLIGFALFVAFFYYYFFRQNRLILTYNKKLYYPLLVMLLIVIFPGRLIGTLTYAPLLLLLLASLKFEKKDETIEYAA